MSKFGPQTPYHVGGDPWPNLGCRGRPTRTHPSQRCSPRGAQPWVHITQKTSPPPPNPIPTKDPTTPTTTYDRKGVGGISAPPPTTRYGDRGVGHTVGKREPHGPTTSTGTGILGDLRHCQPSLCSCTERSGGVGSGNSPTLTFTCRTFREVHGTLATPTSLHMRGGRGCRLTSHLGGGVTRKGAHRGACHPQPDTIEGDPIMSEVFWGKVNLQRLPPTFDVSEERVFGETIPGSSLRWGGVHTLDEPKGYG